MNGVTELLQALHEPMASMGAISGVEVSGTQILVDSSVAQQVIGDDQDRVGHRHGRTLSPATSSEAMVLSR